MQRPDDDGYLGVEDRHWSAGGVQRHQYPVQHPLWTVRKNQLPSISAYDDADDQGRDDDEGDDPRDEQPAFDHDQRDRIGEHGRKRRGDHADPQRVPEHPGIQVDIDEPRVVRQRERSSDDPLAVLGLDAREQQRNRRVEEEVRQEKQQRDRQEPGGQTQAPPRSLPDLWLGNYSHRIVAGGHRWPSSTARYQGLPLFKQSLSVDILVRQDCLGLGPLQTVM